MKTIFNVILVLFFIIIISISIWFSLDKNTRCKFIYGINICNFYAMLDIASNNPSISNFGKMMSLCGEMENVPKKDSCFEIVAETFTNIDSTKAKEACHEIQDINDEAGNIVHKKEDCYNKITK